MPILVLTGNLSTETKRRALNDDGIGLSSESPTRPDRLGIVGMQERAVLLGGSFELMERDPSGLEVRVRVPYDVLNVSRRQG